MKPLLTLCMIVKDEAHGIAKTLRSAKPFVDRWCILDTGSTDGTPGIVQRELSGIPGLPCVEPFVDFASTRNRLLQLATLPSDPLVSEFLLLLDADDVLEGGEALRTFLQHEQRRILAASGTLTPTEPWTWADEQATREPEAREAFYVRMSEQACEWHSARVVRASAVGGDIVADGPAHPSVAFTRQGWHYVGAVHEVLAHPSGRVPTITIPGVHIRHERGPVSAERMRARWERDVTLLRAAVTKDPKDARSWFYLGRTLRQQGHDIEGARIAFQSRIALGGWREEVFEAMREQAMLEPTPESIVAGLLAAHAHSPHRAEPLVDLAEFYRAENEHGPAFTFASRAAALPYPREGLFIDGDVYQWKAAALVSISAWYVGEFEAGEAATRKALANDPPEPWRHALAENLRMYEERKAAR